MIKRGEYYDGVYIDPQDKEKIAEQIRKNKDKYNIFLEQDGRAGNNRMHDNTGQIYDKYDVKGNKFTGGPRDLTGENMYDNSHDMYSGQNFQGGPRRHTAIGHEIGDHSKGDPNMRPGTHGGRGGNDIGDYSRGDHHLRPGTGQGRGGYEVGDYSRGDPNRPRTTGERGDYEVGDYSKGDPNRPGSHSGRDGQGNQIGGYSKGDPKTNSTTSGCQLKTRANQYGHGGKGPGNHTNSEKVIEEKGESKFDSDFFAFDEPHKPKHKTDQHGHNQPKKTRTGDLGQIEEEEDPYNRNDKKISGVGQFKDDNTQPQADPNIFTSNFFDFGDRIDTPEITNTVSNKHIANKEYNRNIEEDYDRSKGIYIKNKDKRPNLQQGGNQQHGGNHQVHAGDRKNPNFNKNNFKFDSGFVEQDQQYNNAHGKDSNFAVAGIKGKINKPYSKGGNNSIGGIDLTENRSQNHGNEINLVANNSSTKFIRKNNNTPGFTNPDNTETNPSLQKRVSNNPKDAPSLAGLIRGEYSNEAKPTNFQGNQKNINMASDLEGATPMQGVDIIQFDFMSPDPKQAPPGWGILTGNNKGANVANKNNMGRGINILADGSSRNVGGDGPNGGKKPKYGFNPAMDNNDKKQKSGETQRSDLMSFLTSGFGNDDKNDNKDHPKSPNAGDSKNKEKTGGILGNKLQDSVVGGLQRCDSQEIIGDDNRPRGVFATFDINDIEDNYDIEDNQGPTGNRQPVPGANNLPFSKKKKYLKKKKTKEFGAVEQKIIPINNEIIDFDAELAKLMPQKANKKEIAEFKHQLSDNLPKYKNFVKEVENIVMINHQS